MIYMLDTNIISDVIKHPRGTVSQKIRTLPKNSACVSVIVAGELRYGAMKKSNDELTRRVEDILRKMAVFDLNYECSVFYGNIRADLEKKGLPIGANDLWIAAHALSLGLIFVTNNEKEFCRVDGLKMENWLN